MCGRYTLTEPSEIIKDVGFAGVEAARRGGEALTGDGAPGTLASLLLRPRYNIAPTQAAPIVRAATDPRLSAPREVTLLRWGLIPFWSKDLEIGHRMINARSETVDTKPAFRGAFKYRRCVVLADGFYEWKKMRGGKQPYHIHLGNRRAFAMAGLWESWDKGPEGPVESFTILTTKANERVADLHDRMPVILDRAGRDTWLNPRAEPGALLGLLRPYPTDAMAYDPVSKAVNNPRHDGAELIVPVDLEAAAKTAVGVQTTLFD